MGKKRRVMMTVNNTSARKKFSPSRLYIRTRIFMNGLTITAFQTVPMKPKVFPSYFVAYSHSRFRCNTSSAKYSPSIFVKYTVLSFAVRGAITELRAASSQR